MQTQTGVMVRESGRELAARKSIDQNARARKVTSHPASTIVRTNKQNQPSSGQVGRWMDRIAEFTSLVETKLLKNISEELKIFLAEFAPELKPEYLAKQVRSYLAYADKPVRLYHGGREVVRTFWYCILHPEFEVVNQDELEEGYFQLLLFPDFQLLHPMIRRWYEHAVELNIEWRKAKEIAEAAIQKLATSQESDPKVATIGLRTPIRSRRDPHVAARFSVISNALSRNRRSKALDICRLLDYHNISIPEHWKEEGLNNWVAAYMDPQYRGNVQKLISVEKSKVLRPSTR